MVPFFRPLVTLLAAALCSGVLLSCAGSSGGGGTSASGVVYAPNGVDPVPGASIRIVPSAGTDIPVTYAVVSDSPAVAEAVSGARGGFALTGLAPGNYTLIVSLGRFSKVSALYVPEGVDTPIPPPQTTLPGLDGVGAVAPRIAVVTGFYDDMTHVIAKFGMGAVDERGALVLGTETFDIYQGGGGVPVWNAEYEYWEYLDFPEGYRTADALLGSLEAMRAYDLIVLNCQVDFSYADFEDPGFAARVREYVRLGGKLLVTDLSYNFVEQPFPEFVRFMAGGEDAPSVPEPVGAAGVGMGGITTEAAVRDAGLAAWLGGLGALNDNGTLHVGDLWGGWAVMSAPEPTPEGGQVKVWVEGPVTYDGYDDQGNYELVEGATRPLTVSFPFGAGEVIYSSYHTSGEPHPGFTPQERVLEYLLFQ